ncbi:unknown [Candidatus Colimorpha enterica]|uniref:Uncharacterized protein n=1 Tax=Candidatus Colimorpha enterica TaxID=3083063 RepID=R6TLM5_9BACT|nr:unknown [Candidatus Colimorpha enterica]
MLVLTGAADGDGRNALRHIFCKCRIFFQNPCDFRIEFRLLFFLRDIPADDGEPVSGCVGQRNAESLHFGEHGFKSLSGIQPHGDCARGNSGRKNRNIIRHGFHRISSAEDRKKSIAFFSYRVDVFFIPAHVGKKPVAVRGLRFRAVSAHVGVGGRGGNVAPPGIFPADSIEYERAGG